MYRQVGLGLGYIELTGMYRQVGYELTGMYRQVGYELTGMYRQVG